MTLNGKIVQGNHDLEIKKVVTRLRRLEDHTLFLDMWGRKKPDLTIPLKHHSFAIVTAWPQKFDKLKGRCTIIKVADPGKAYWNFIRYYRSLLDIPVIGITGTCGKTTTKDMIRHILESQYTVQATKRSLNDSVYNLKYLTGIDESTEVAVIEMGVAYPGDLLYCCKHFQQAS